MDFQCHVQNFKWEAQHGSLKESDTLLTIQGKLKEAVTVWKDPVEFLIKLCEDVKKKEELTAEFNRKVQENAHHKEVTEKQIGEIEGDVDGAVECSLMASQKPNIKMSKMSDLEDGS